MKYIFLHTPLNELNKAANTSVPGLLWLNNCTLRNNYEMKIFFSL